MFPCINPTTTPSWQLLLKHYLDTKNSKIKELFAADNQRFSKYSIKLQNIVFDYSKSNITEITKALLIQLAKECKLDEAIAAMFAGEKINKTEKIGRAHV